MSANDNKGLPFENKGNRFLNIGVCIIENSHASLFFIFQTTLFKTENVTASGSFSKFNSFFTVFSIRF